MEKKILIIDEEGISIKGITYLLETKVPEVSWNVCRTCSAGLNELRAARYDLLILDMMLPTGEWLSKAHRDDNLYGVDLLEDIRKDFKELPIICYTIVQDSYVIEKVTRLGAVYLCKLSHNNRQDLVSQINQLLKRKL